MTPSFTSKRTVLSKLRAIESNVFFVLELVVVNVPSAPSDDKVSVYELDRNRDRVGGSISVEVLALERIDVGQEELRSYRFQIGFLLPDFSSFKDVLTIPDTSQIEVTITDNGEGSVEFP